MKSQSKLRAALTLRGQAQPHLSGASGRPGCSGGCGGLVDRVQNSARAVQKFFARRQEAHPSRRAGKEGRPDLRFERLDLAAHRRLRDVQPFRGATYVSFFCDGNEVADLREAHRGSIPKRYWIGEGCLCMVLAWVSKS